VPRNLGKRVSRKGEVRLPNVTEISKKIKLEQYIDFSMQDFVFDLFQKFSSWRK
jgi:hypothetical protein